MARQLLTSQALDLLWQNAIKYWSPVILLSAPHIDNQQTSLARICMQSRQVTLNIEKIEKQQLGHCIEAIFAHEIGHHFRYPGNLRTHAKLLLIEKQFFPTKQVNTLNIFTDLLINQHLGRSLSAQLIAIYQQMNQEHTEHNALYAFYMALYETLWQLPEGTLIPDSLHFRQQYPSYKTLAQQGCENIFQVKDNLYQQLLAFLFAITAFIDNSTDAPEKPLHPPCCQNNTPDANDLASALTLSEKEKKAIKHAEEAQWLNAKQAKKMTHSEERIALLPSLCEQKTRRKVMLQHYKKLVAQYVIRLPMQRQQSDAIVPTQLENWQMGDPVQSIDWLSTLSEGQELAMISPYKRQFESENEGYEQKGEKTYVELYLDVSGSMPHPEQKINALTLSAMILMQNTLNHQGLIRILLYSTQVIKSWQWSNALEKSYQFLMQTMGEGTRFPFAELQQSAENCPYRPLRIILSDHDFISNFENHLDAAKILKTAVQKSQQVFIILHGHCPNISLLTQCGATVLCVKSVSEMPKIVSQLEAQLW